MRGCLNVEREELFQEGMLAVAEAYLEYAYKLQDEELLKVSHRLINRRMYKYAKDEYKYNRTFRQEDKETCE